MEGPDDCEAFTFRCRVILLRIGERTRPEADWFACSFVVLEQRGAESICAAVRVYRVQEVGDGSARTGGEQIRLMNVRKALSCSSFNSKVSGEFFRRSWFSGYARTAKFSMNRRYTLHKPRNDRSYDFVVGGFASFNDLVLVSSI